MASPAPTASRRSRRREPQIKVPSSPAAVMADVISYGYAFVVVWATLQFSLQFSIAEGIGIMVIFVLLRAVAHEIRADLRRQALREARRMAALRAQSPARWTEEQRDGIGRRIDVCR